MLESAADIIRDFVAVPLFGALIVLTAWTAVRPVTRRATARWLEKRRLPTTDAAVDEARPSLRRLWLTLLVGFLPALLAQPYSPVVLFAVPYLLDDRARRAVTAPGHSQPGRAAGGLLDRFEPRPLRWHEWLGAGLAGLGVIVASVVVVVEGFDAIAALGYSTLACTGAAALIVFGPADVPAIAGEPLVARYVSARLRLAALGAAWYAVALGLRRVAQASADALGDSTAADVLGFLGTAINPVAMLLLLGFAFFAPKLLVVPGRPAPAPRLPPPPNW